MAAEWCNCLGIDREDADLNRRKICTGRHQGRILTLGHGLKAFLVCLVAAAALCLGTASGQAQTATDPVQTDGLIEVGDAAVPALQKRMIRMAREKNKLAITTTQMMESMISNSMPTRAEVFDVANAVLDGTDAVMLSAETAVGSYPVEVVRAMANAAVGAESHPVARTSRYRQDREFRSTQETVALSAMYGANHFPGVRRKALADAGFNVKGPRAKREK